MPFEIPQVNIEKIARARTARETGVLRDRFAIAALALTGDAACGTNNGGWEDRAAWAYGMADAMLAERENSNAKV